MDWTNVKGNRWERPLDGLEGYFVVMANLSASLCEGREHYTLFSKLKLEVDSPDMTSALKHAWKQIRYEQPQIATTVEGMKRVYEVPDEKALEEWLASTFVVSPASDAEELYQTVTPIKQATIYYLPASSELVFRGHHHTIDGVGVLLFWDSYLSALASPNKDIQFGDETPRLAPVMQEVLGYAAQPTEAMLEKASALFMSWAGSIPGVGPVSKLGAVASGNCRNIELVFPTKTTKELVEACKAENVSLTAAVHAAYVKAIAKHADPESKLSEYVSANQFNLRSYLPEPYNSSKYAVSVFYTPLPYKVGLPASYQDVVKSLNGYYKNAIKSNPEALELKGHFTNVLCGAVQTPEFLASPVSKDALVSSLGIAERYVQREYGSGIKVKDIKVGVDVVMGMSMFFFYTFQDQLRLVYSFNDGFEEPENIQTYLDEIRDILTKELIV
ncbi:hypothetical protein G7Z17_g64 [Cylindrodendrum hubeiense]|uniref:Acyltransferase n=1 Tax=Cylindrodendrum hubeiense TaxID=595255 RepID=A0A9P5LMT5_9HYPO|nr:hypothetical protein G7Z17_g64 [Cylindrodendrum hubeiense]